MHLLWSLAAFAVADNPRTQRLFCDRYADRVKASRPIPCEWKGSKAGGDGDGGGDGPSEHRCTPVADALVDLYTCVGAQRFKGTYMSSFSDTISQVMPRRPNRAGPCICSDRTMRPAVATRARLRSRQRRARDPARDKLAPQTAPAARARTQTVSRCLLHRSLGGKFYDETDFGVDVLLSPGGLAQLEQQPATERAPRSLEPAPS